MDKRTILAFVLIFLVWIGWAKIYEKIYGKPTRRAAADSSEVVILPADTLRSGFQEGAIGGEVTGTRDRSARPEEDPHVSQTVSPDQVLTFREPFPPPRTVRVLTPLYELDLSTTGARITSWRGIQFMGLDGGSVQLIPPPAERGLRGNDAIVFQGRGLDLGYAPYTVEGPTELRLGEEDTEQQVVLRAETNGGLVVTKTYTFCAQRYDINVDVQVFVPSDIAHLVGDPTRARFGWNEGIASTERDKKSEAPSFRSFAMVGEEVVFKKRTDIRKPEKVKESFQGSVRYAGLQNQYFIVAGVVPSDPSTVVDGRILLDADPEANQLIWALELPFQNQPADGGTLSSSQMMLYLGPSEVDLLKSYGRELERIVDLGWKIFRPLSELILACMLWLYRWIPNYGIIIIILSVLTKLMFYPLTRTSTKSMKKMQELQPKLKALQEKYKDNREKLSKETMALYKKEKVNPMAGCLPLLVQSPVFIALFQALRNTIALRQAPFALWIDDLAQPDAMFQLPISLPFLGSNFNLLPILMSLSMYLQTKLTPSAASGGQMALMNTMLPFMMLIFFYNMPSGLVLYWLVNTVMTIYQTWRIHRTAPTTGGAQSA